MTTVEMIEAREVGAAPLTAGTHAPGATWAGRLGRAARAAVAGALFGAALSLLFPWPVQRLMPICAAAAALLVWTRLRRLAWPAATALLALVALVAFTPVARPLLRQLERSDPAAPAPAVVVLGGGSFKDGTPSAPTEDRVLQGYALVRRGEAPLMVLTRPQPAKAVPWDLSVREQIRELGLPIPVEVVGPVVNTHDEALAVATLARQRGWGRVILVTDPWHMRRAAAVFEKAGVPVICSPCVERLHDLHALEDQEDRLAVVRLWVRETIGYGLYKLRGWV